MEKSASQTKKQSKVVFVTERPSKFNTFHWWTQTLAFGDFMTLMYKLVKNRKKSVLNRWLLLTDWFDREQITCILHYLLFSLFTYQTFYMNISTCFEATIELHINGVKERKQTHWFISQFHRCLLFWALSKFSNEHRDKNPLESLSSKVFLPWESTFSITSCDNRRCALRFCW